MARYLRDACDKLRGLVSMDSGVQLHELVLRLLREEGEFLGPEELRDLMQHTVRQAATRGSARAMAALLNVVENHPGTGIDLLSSVNSFGHTPLMLAAQHGHADVIEQLLDHHHATMHGDVMEHVPTTMHEDVMKHNHAAMHGEVMRDMFATPREHQHHSTCDTGRKGSNAEVTQRSNTGATALDMVARRGDVTIMQLIVKHVEVSGTEVGEMFWYTALTGAAEKGHLEPVRLLIQHGIDPNLNLDAYIGSALHCAVESGDVACVQELLRHGADIESLRTCVQQTPLMRACEYGHVDIVRCLIEAGANVHRQTANCSNALTVAGHYGHEHVVDFLLGHGADPHKRNPWGFTPLYLSADCPAILQRLLQAGVDVNVQCGERAESALHLASVIGFIPVCQALLAAGADVDCVTTYEETALWLAIWKAHDDVATLLIQENGRLNVPSNGCQVYLWHYTPMELALGSGKLHVANLLYEAGCPLFNPVYFAHSSPPPVRTLPGVYLREEILQYVEQEPELSKWMVEVCSKPQSLKQFARIVIRQGIGKNPRKKIEQLPLPPLLKAYVAME